MNRLIVPQMPPDLTPNAKGVVLAMPRYPLHLPERASDYDYDEGEPLPFAPWHNPIIGIIHEYSDWAFLRLNSVTQPRRTFFSPGWCWASDYRYDSWQPACPDLVKYPVEDELSYPTLWEAAKRSKFADGAAHPRDFLQNEGFHPLRVKVLEIAEQDDKWWAITVDVMSVFADDDIAAFAEKDLNDGNR